MRSGDERLSPRPIQVEGLNSIARKLRLEKKVIVKTPSNPASLGCLASWLVENPALPAGPILLVAADELTRVKVWQSFCFWQKRANKKIKSDFQATAAVDSLILSKIASGESVFLITTTEELSANIPGPDVFAKHCLRLKVGEKILRPKMLSQLALSGYTLERAAVAPGLIANRGGVVDIFPRGEEAIRVEFEGDIIDSLKTFLPGKPPNQSLKEATIIPYKLDHIEGQGKLLDYHPQIKQLLIDPFPSQPDAVVPFSESQLKELSALLAPARQEAKKMLRDFSFIKKLRPGDFVIHADHGLAAFDGIVEQTIDNIGAEYFKLLYAEGDKLFVPVTLAEKIEKYIGEAQPALNRLSGTLWQKAVEKVRLETLSEARGLLNTHARRELAKALPIKRSPKIEKTLAASFQYQETTDQERAIEAIYRDLAGERPMDRLVCGDVGFGKTEVAVRAAAKVALAGYQTVVLSPTTILAQQHIDTFQERLKNLPVIINGLSRFESKKEQAKIIKDLGAGKIDIIIGTHRLLSGDIAFKNLGLIIIDEEQRFGVEHKEVLKKLRSQAHVLTLSATPIPRTLHLALSGVRDISNISTPPRGRLSIDTHIEPHNHTQIKEALERELKRAGQAYYLYNNIETIELKKKELQALVPKARFGVLHGQLPEQEVASVMHGFDKGEIDILVCSTIIENGLDLPNVNTLVVDNAVQFGLSQLHQIRGRIGRGERQAYAYMFYQRQKLTGEAEKRLRALEEARDLGSGFDLAMRDMEIRGVGNIMGKEQHGHVAAIGLGMYLRLLHQAVEEIQTGERVEILPHIAVDLPLEARIPQFFEPNKEKRIELYHHWALIEDLDELKETKAKLEKDGRLPKAADNLFTILRLKILGRKAGIEQIDSMAGNGAGETIIIKPYQPIAPQRFAKLLSVSSTWLYATDEIKIPKKDLGEDWLQKLEKCLQLLAESV